MKFYAMENFKNNIIIVEFNPDNNKYMTFTRENTTKTVKIIDNYEFTFKCNKTSISARDGAAGLYNFLLKECFNSAGCFRCYGNKIIDNIFNTMK